MTFGLDILILLIIFFKLMEQSIGVTTYNPH